MPDLDRREYGRGRAAFSLDGGSSALVHVCGARTRGLFVDGDAALRMRDGQHHVQIVHGRHGWCARELGGPAVVAIGVDEDEALPNLGDTLARLVSRGNGRR